MFAWGTPGANSEVREALWLGRVRMGCIVNESVAPVVVAYLPFRLPQKSHRHDSRRCLMGRRKQRKGLKVAVQLSHFNTILSLFCDSVECANFYNSVIAEVPEVGG